MTNSCLPLSCLPQYYNNIIEYSVQFVKERYKKEKYVISKIVTLEYESKFEHSWHLLMICC